MRLPALLALSLLATNASAATAPRASTSVPYVIVTDASLAAAFGPLAAAHTAAGLNTEVHTVQDIVAAYPAAADDAERIRKFLIDAHASLGTTFVLLGGDDPVVPIRRVLLHPALNDVLLPTDQYYACLDGTWNADGDANWGESPNPGAGEPGDAVDFTPELNVGRAPVTTEAEAQVFVAKSLAALAAQDGSLPVSVLSAANAIELFPQPLDNANFNETLLPIFAAHPGTHVARLYQLSANWPGSFPENRQSVLDSLNHGYDIAVLNGQGGVGLFQAGTYPADLVSAADLGAQTNTSRTFAVFTSAYTNQPGPGSIGAAWLNDALGGATSVLGSTDIQFLSLTNTFAREFLHQAFELHVPTQGEALSAAVLTMAPYNTSDNARLTTEGNLLLGDPALAWPGSLVGGPTPTLLTLVDASAEGGSAKLSWYASHASAAGALVERRTEGADWQAIGAPGEQGDGVLTYEDRVAAGGRFAYRLRLAGGETSEEVWLTIPGAASRLALAGFTPNPTTAGLNVAFTLATAEPATLDLVDVAGRRVAHRDVGELGPGAHVIDLAAAGRPPAGVYWIRLVQGARQLVTRGVIM